MVERAAFVFHKDKKMKVGDVVRLKSGGPEMTLVDSYGDGSFLAGWFDGGTYESAAFSEAALDIVSST